MSRLRMATLSIVALWSTSALSQDKGSLEPRPLPALAHPQDPRLAAKELFGRVLHPTSTPTHSVGTYARGCLAGAQALPIDGPYWQVMRLSRNRNWGSAALVSFLERLAGQVPRINGWPGLLIGDISQPRGGPMITGHASHQIGLDADIWLTQMPNRTLSRAERENMSATDLVRSDGLDVNAQVWTAEHGALIRAAASQSDVARVFVNPAIKKALCREAGPDRSWLRKVRPTWGHTYHFHVRLLCPNGEAGCANQAPPPPGDGCDADLAYWFRPDILHPRPTRPRPPLTLATLPNECRNILDLP